MTAGHAGESGPSGAAGMEGATGRSGAQGAVGVVANWTPYRSYGFDYNRANIQSSETGTASDIATYVRKNRSLEVGIDGSTNGTGSAQQDLNSRRVIAIRDALIEAGVPADKIRTGAFGDPQLRRDRKVEVLLKTE
jgi:outer membrane protein OmpA-like peptidoglycan-associated protein